MGLRSRLKRKFYRMIRLYDEPYGLYASMRGRKAILPSLNKEQSSGSEPRKVIRIWRRNLKPLKEMPTVGRLGHWCIQVDQTYFELLIPNGSTELGITECPAHPFEGYRYEASSTTSTTTFTAEQILTIAHDVYASEFEDCYGVGRQDCQRFVMRLFKEVCARGDEHKVDALYAGSFSLPLAYSTMSPPTHITNPNKVTTARSHSTNPGISSHRSHAAKGHGTSGHGGSDGGSSVISGLLATIITTVLTMPPPPR